MRILFYLDIDNKQPWVEALSNALPGADIRVWPNWGAPDDLPDGPAYAYVWEPPEGLLATYTYLEAVFSIGAGVDHLTRDPDLPHHLPIIRMSDDGLKEGMAEHVLMFVLALHRKLPQSLRQQKNRVWQRHISPAARHMTIGLMGYGALGSHVAAALKPLGYKLISWSRTSKTADALLDGSYAGQYLLENFLANADIVVGLLPATPETSGLINENRIAAMKPGSGIINAGRGSLIVMDDLIAALNTGHLSGAFLDVFTTEPLAPEHPAWTTENLFITPHVAAITRPDTAAQYVADNIARIQAGEQPLNLLERALGY